MEIPSRVNRAVSQLSLSDEAKEEAFRIYRKAEDGDLLRGRSSSQILAGAFYLAGRRSEEPRPLREVAEVFKVQPKRVNKGYKYLIREFDIEVPPVDPTDHLRHLSERLDLSEKTEEKALEILEEVRRRGLFSGKSPYGYTAAATYIAGLLCGEGLTQREVTKATYVSEITVRTRYQELVEELDIDISLEILKRSLG